MKIKRYDRGLNPFAALLAVMVLLFIAGCEGRDSALVGIWQANLMQINRWDFGAVPPGKAVTFEFFTDGTGTVKKGENLTDIRWSTGTHSLRITGPDGERLFGYTLKKDGMLALTDENDTTILYTRKENSK